VYDNKQSFTLSCDVCENIVASLYLLEHKYLFLQVFGNMSKMEKMDE